MPHVISHSSIRHRSCLGLGLLTLALLPLVSHGSTVFTDDFTSATATGTTNVAGGTSYITSSTVYYSTNTATGGGPVAIATSTQTPLGGNALYFNGYGTNSTAVASFSQVNLALGTYITVSVDYYSVSGSGTPFLGLYNDSGTALAANQYGSLDAGGATSPLHGDKGYNFVKTLGSTTNDIKIYQELPSQWKREQFRSVNGVTLQTASSGISSGVPVTMSLTLARELNGDLSITAAYGAFSTTQTVAAANVLTTSFNELVFAGYGQSYFDNISITTGTGSGAAIPEPSTSALLVGIGALTLIATRRQRRG
jgi:hypothetical protein